MSVGIVGFGFLLWAHGVTVRTPYLSNYRDWSPTASEIKATIDAERASFRGTPGEREAACRRVFRDQFQQRYRRHDQPEAIGLRFMADGDIKLFVPARMEPWNVDIVAEQAFDEAQTDLGKSCRIDICATYLGGISAKHLASLVPSPSNPRSATITYVRDAYAATFMP
jgi:hypothetical protein